MWTRPLMRLSGKKFVYYADSSLINCSSRSLINPYDIHDSLVVLNNNKCREVLKQLLKELPVTYSNSSSLLRASLKAFLHDRRPSQVNLWSLHKPPVRGTVFPYPSNTHTEFKYMYLRYSSLLIGKLHHVDGILDLWRDSWLEAQSVLYLRLR